MVSFWKRSSPLSYVKLPDPGSAISCVTNSDPSAMSGSFPQSLKVDVFWSLLLGSLESFNAPFLDSLLNLHMLCQLVHGHVQLDTPLSLQMLHVWDQHCHLFSKPKPVTSMHLSS